MAQEFRRTTDLARSRSRRGKPKRPDWAEHSYTLREISANGEWLVGCEAHKPPVVCSSRAEAFQWIREHEKESTTE